MVLFGVAQGHAERRVALVIGNGAYEHADQLTNPVIDARRLRDALTKLGFEVVFAENVTKQALERSIGDFANAAQDADVALVYYAGHGATFGDVPYVVPTDARFSSLAGMPYELVPVETLIGELRRAKGLRIAILDACRDNSAERNLKRTAVRGGEVSRGLARVRNPEGLILAYATQYMETAKDGPPNQDSPFTAALLDNIATPGLDVKDLFFRVGNEVITKTKGEQRPEISVSFYDSYALVTGSSAPAAPVNTPVSAPVSIPIGPSPDQAAWDFIKDTDSVEILKHFIFQFPNSPHRSEAEQRIKKIASIPTNNNESRPARPAAVTRPAASPHVETPAKPKAKKKPQQELHTRAERPKGNCFAFNGQQICE